MKLIVTCSFAIKNQLLITLEAICCYPIALHCPVLELIVYAAEQLVNKTAIVCLCEFKRGIIKKIIPEHCNAK